MGGAAVAAPARGPLSKPPVTEWSPGRAHDRVVVKVAEGVPGTPVLEGTQARPLFQRSPAKLQEDKARYTPEGASLDRYFLVETLPGAGPSVADQFNEEVWVELAYLAFAPQPPPGDLAPTTPDFTEAQGWLGWAPSGFGFFEGDLWPGGDGSNVTIVDIEYSWTPDHEDLDAVDPAMAWGWDSHDYAFHGTGVLGILVGGDNGYGVRGGAPGAEALVVSPFSAQDQYSVAAAIDGAAALLDEGDVILIEQQAYDHGNYAPVEIDAAVFDAIVLATARGIVVVEPTGNGAHDLDSAVWSNKFNPDRRDSGAILVGGGASPNTSYDARTWFPGGSCYGERVNVQGWFDSIVSTMNADYGGTYANLWLPSTSEHPSGDPRQGYTSTFGGTSGASPQVAAAAAVVNSVAIEVRGEALAPEDLRALMVSTGTPQPSDDPFPIGPQPDVRRMIRYGVLP